MDDVPELGTEVEETLQEFVTEWRRELVTPRPSRRLLGKREDREVEEETGESADVPHEKKRVVVRREPSPLLVLPPGRGKRALSEPAASEESRRASPSLLDTLIADLDDINTIPFFEVKLPREVALLIFRHLNMTDLCTCSQVSRSWHSLVEDNMLWSGVCQKMGYDTSLEDGGRVVWKTVVKEIVLRKKKELRNWKERVCGLSDLQPDREGILVCVDFCPLQEQLLAGYSSGAVFVWTLTSEEGPLILESGPAHSSSRPALCCISQGWAAVATDDGVVTVYDGSVGGALHRVGGLGHVTSLDLRRTDNSLMVAVASAAHIQGPGGAEAPVVVQSEVTVLASRDGAEWQIQVVRPLQDGPSKTVNQLAVLESCNPALLYSTQTTLSLHPLPSPPSLPHPPPPSHILTSAGSAGNTVINCFDHTPSVVACATSAWGYHVQLYDLSTGAHLTTLRGHAQPVTALNIRSSPAHTLVTGAADRRVRVFDTRRSQPVVTLSGHHGAVISTQCDDWKVASGGRDGLVVVWDQRMTRAELWSSHERHPVAGVWFTHRYLAAAHLPEKGAWQEVGLTDQSEPLHRCQRGLLRVMDFSVDPLFYTRLLPSVCSSGYDEPCRSRHHLDLKLPYDTIT